MAIKNYSFDFKKLITWMLPIFYRIDFWISWIYVMLAKVRVIHAEFISFFNLKKDEIKWNGQTISLENLLREKYGSGIYITTQSNDAYPFYVYDVNNTLNPFIWGVNDAENPMAHSVNAYNLEQINYFIVHVPVIISFDSDEMAALIRQYNQYGTTFSIVTF